MLKKLCSVFASAGLAATLICPVSAFAATSSAESEQAEGTATSATDSSSDAKAGTTSSSSSEEAAEPKKKTGTLPTTNYTATLPQAKIEKATSTASSVKVKVTAPKKATKKSKVAVASDTAQRYSTKKKKFVSDARYVGSKKKLKAGQVVLKLTQAGTHKIKLDIDNVEYSLKVKTTAKTKKSSYLMLYKGQKAQLQSGLANAKWSSSSPLVAKVSKSGVVSSSEVGHATLTAKIDGVTLTCNVESTYKKAYKAVENAYTDFKTKISYSQGLRMKRYYRDCSSFVARTYWDNLLGRKLLVIGNSENKKWALPAADQAEWLNNKGRRVSYSRTSVDNLLPGDTIYVLSSYGSGGGYRGINHACMYVGNGKVLDGTGTDGVGTVGYRNYSTTNVKFIGRPCAALELDQSAAELIEGQTLSLSAKYATDTITWKTSNKKIATVSSDGTVTAKKAGTAKITAKAGSKKYSCQVTVDPPYTFSTTS